MTVDALATRIQEGDRSACTEIVDRYGKMVYYTAYAQTEDREKALDASKRTFRTLFTEIRKGNIPDDTVDYLQQVACVQTKCIISEDVIMDELKTKISSHDDLDRFFKTSTTFGEPAAIQRVDQAQPPMTNPSVTSMGPQIQGIPMTDPSTTATFAFAGYARQMTMTQMPVGAWPQQTASWQVPQAASWQVPQDMQQTASWQAPQAAPQQTASWQVPQAAPQAAPQPVQQQTASWQTPQTASQQVAQMFAPQTQAHQTAPLPPVQKAVCASPAPVAKVDDTAIPQIEVPPVVVETKSPQADTASVLEHIPSVIDETSLDTMVPGSDLFSDTMRNAMIEDLEPVTVADIKPSLEPAYVTVPTGQFKRVHDDLPEPPQSPDKQSAIYQQFYGKAEEIGYRKNRIAFSLGIVLTAFLVLVLVWAVVGLLAKMGVVTGVDSAYTWFNSAVYPLF